MRVNKLVVGRIIMGFSVSMTFKAVTGNTYGYNSDLSNSSSSWGNQWNLDSASKRWLTTADLMLLAEAQHHRYIKTD